MLNSLPRRSASLLVLLVIAVFASKAQAQFESPSIPGFPGGGGGGGFNSLTATRIDSTGVATIYSDLQKAIDDAGPGDTIQLDDGVWEAGLKVMNKYNLLITGPGAAQRAVIDGQYLTQGMELSGCMNVEIRNLEFRRCVSYGSPAPARGGGISIEGGHHVKIRNCTFLRCVADSGGAIYATQSPVLAITNCALIDNIAKDDHGGGVDLYRNGDVDIDSCTFGNNIAQGNGGGIHAIFDGTSITISDCRFLHNQAFGNGGGLFFFNFGTLTSVATMTDCHFTGNRAFALGQSQPDHFGGGGLLIEGLWILNGTAVHFDRNRSTRGGAISAADGTVIVMEDGSMLGNRAGEGNDHAWLDATSLIRLSDTTSECGDGFSEHIEGTWVDASGNHVRQGCVVTADVDFDGQVGLTDLLTMLSQWGPSSQSMCDIERAAGETNSRVDTADLVRLMNAWGESTLPSIIMPPSNATGENYPGGGLFENF